MKDFKSELYKFVKTKGHLIHILVPVLGILIFALYFKVSAMADYSKFILYIEVIGILMPGLTAVVVTKQYEDERKAGGFQNILAYPGKRIMGHVSRLIILIMFGFIAMGVAVFGMSFFLHIEESLLLNMWLYFKIFIFMFLGSLHWYIIQYMVCFSFGSGISLGMGAIGSVMAALMRVGLSLGDSIWQFMPSCYATRIGVSIGKMRVWTEGSEREYVELTLKNGIIYLFVIMVMEIPTFTLWGSLWTGNGKEE